MLEIKGQVLHRVRLHVKVPGWLLNISYPTRAHGIIVKDINSSLHLARKYPRIFVRGHYLFREANSFPRAKLEENCELRGTDNVQGQISEHIFAAKLRLLCILSIGFKNWGMSSDIPSFSWGIFAHVTRLDQSRSSD